MQSGGGPGRGARDPAGAGGRTGKANNFLDRIVEGRLGRFYEDNCLLTRSRHGGEAQRPGAGPSVSQTMYKCMQGGDGMTDFAHLLRLRSQRRKPTANKEKLQHVQCPNT